MTVFGFTIFSGEICTCKNAIIIRVVNGLAFSMVMVYKNISHKINSNNDLLYLPPSSKGALTSSWISSRHCWPRTIPICCCLTKIALVDPWPAISGSHPARQWPSCLSSSPVCISICEWQRSCGIWCCWGRWPIGDSQRCFSRCDAVEDEGYLVPFGWGNHWIT